MPEEEAVSEEVGSGEEATSPLRVPPVVQQQQAITAAMAERQQRTYDRIKATADVTADYTKGIAVRLCIPSDLRGGSDCTKLLCRVLRRVERGRAQPRFNLICQYGVLDSEYPGHELEPARNVAAPELDAIPFNPRDRTWAQNTITLAHAAQQQSYAVCKGCGCRVGGCGPSSRCGCRQAGVLCGRHCKCCAGGHACSNYQQRETSAVPQPAAPAEPAPIAVPEQQQQEPMRQSEGQAARRQAAEQQQAPGRRRAAQ